MRMDPGFEHRELGDIQPPPADLIGIGRIGEAIAHHPGACGQRGLDALGEMLATAREHQQRLGFEVHGLVQDELAQALAQRRAARFAGLLDRQAARAQQ